MRLNKILLMTQKYLHGLPELCIIASLVIGCCPQNKEQQDNKKLRGLLYNYDCTDLFFNCPPDKMNDQVVDDQIDLLAEAGVTVMMCNTNAQRTNYNSSAFEPFWSGYDAKDKDDQPFLADMAPASRGPYRRMVESMMVLSNQGVDYPARVISRCRHNNISPWISLRMNDIHNNNELQHPIHSSFWKNHHDCWRVSDRKIDYYDRALDYSHESVRNRYMGLIKETLDRFDIDGLELDFMREPFLFEPGHELAGAKILTGWLTEVRRLVVQSGQERDHSIRLGVRVPANPITAQNLGLDAVLWAQLGLIDLVVVTPRWATLDANMPLALWKQLLSPYPVTLAGGLEIREQAYPNGPARITVPETAIGAAMAALSSGAEVVYLFNYFPSMTAFGWPQEIFIKTLRAMSSVIELDRLSRRHMVTFRDVFAPGETTDYPLPAKGTRLLFRLQTGIRPSGRALVATIGLEPSSSAKTEPPELRINGELCSLQGQNSSVFTFTVSEGALVDQVQVLEVADKTGKSIMVNRVELDIEVTGKAQAGLE